MVIPPSSKVKGFYMIGLRTLGLIGGTLLFACSVNAQDGGVAKPNLLLKQTVEGMPKGDKQEISVLTATLKPGDQTVFHTHRFPVSIYIGRRVHLGNGGPATRHGQSWRGNG